MEKKGIEISNANMGYKTQENELVILKNISLHLTAGELIGIAGINGSGKSTLIRTICGLQPLLNGSVSLSGKQIDSIEREERAKIISVVLTEKIGGFNLSCYDAIAMGRMPYTNLFGALGEEDKRIIERSINECGLQEHRNKLLNELSDGLFQKTMIARCLAQETDIMLLDEPGAFLDYAAKHELFGRLKKLSELNNKCILISSHELDLLLKYCSKVLLVNESGVELIPVQEALANKTFRLISGGYL